MDASKKGKWADGTLLCCRGQDELDEFKLHRTASGAVRGGTTEALLDYLLTSEHCDTADDMDVFVRAFHLHITPRGVMQQLKDRVEMRCPPSMSTRAWDHQQGHVLRTYARCKCGAAHSTPSR